MRHNLELKATFFANSKEVFWVSLLPTFPTLSQRALSLLTKFATTWLCESGFSLILGMKTKTRSKLEISYDARLAYPL